PPVRCGAGRLPDCRCTMNTQTNISPAGRVDVEVVRPIPHFRFVVVAVFWLTAIFLYFDRVNISMAAPLIMSELGLSGARMGLILSMFSWGFIFGHMSGGVAADRLNIRRWGSALFLLWCLATAATGLCRTVSQFVLVRMTFGFSEGAVINPMNKLQNHWLL